jgi:hypothetical protein
LGQGKTPLAASEWGQVGWGQVEQGMPALLPLAPSTPTCNVRQFRGGGP